MLIVRHRPDGTDTPAARLGTAALSALEASLERKSRFYLEATAALTGIGTRCHAACSANGCRTQRCESDLAQLGARVLAFVLAQRAKEETCLRQCRVDFDARAWDAHRQDHASLVRSVTRALDVDCERSPVARAHDLATLLDRHWASHHVGHDQPMLNAVRAQIDQDGSLALG